MVDPSAPVPDDLAGSARMLADFALGSVRTPLLLIDGGGFVEAASPAALADLDLPPDAVRGQPVEAVLGFDPAPALDDVDPRGASTPRAASLRRSATPDGAFRWRAMSLAGVRLDGGWLLEFEREAVDGAETTLLARVERLDELLLDLSERFENLNRYVGLISHDLQAPARRLLSYVELLRGDLHDHVAAEVRSDVATSIDAIDRGARHLLRLTSELLQYSRLGSLPMPLEVVDAQRVLDDTLEQLDDQIAESGASVDIRGHLPPVIASPTFLGVVFQNLVQNGLKYCGEAAPVITVVASPTDDEVRIEVSDNGIGIAHELRAAVFQPFRRLGPGDTSHTGLGLATVRDIVQRFGGTISVTGGAPGAGSTFTLVLRRAPSGADDPES